MKRFLPFFLTLFSFNAFSIDETESFRQRSQDKENFQILSFKLSGKRGNSETEEYNLSYYHSKKFGKNNQHFGFIMASSEYAKSNNIESANNAFAHLRYNYYYRKDKSFELFLQTKKNSFQSLESRDLIGFSYRLEKNKNFAYGAGLFLEKEKYILKDIKKDFKQTRFNIYSVYATPLNENVVISNTLYFQPNIKAVEDYRAYNNFEISSKMTKNIKMKFGIVFEYDSKPVENVKNKDITYNMGFEYIFN